MVEHHVTSNSERQVLCEGPPREKQRKARRKGKGSFSVGKQLSTLPIQSSAAAKLTKVLHRPKTRSMSTLPSTQDDKKTETSDGIERDTNGCIVQRPMDRRSVELEDGHDLWGNKAKLRKGDRPEPTYRPKKGSAKQTVPQDSACTNGSVTSRPVTRSMQAPKVRYSGLSIHKVEMAVQLSNKCSNGGIQKLKSMRSILKEMQKSSKLHKTCTRGAVKRGLILDAPPAKNTRSRGSLTSSQLSRPGTRSQSKLR